MNREAKWTPERVQQLRSCVTAGLTCSQIASALGVSRNAVIGKMHRLGLAPGRPAALAKQMRRTRSTRIAQILRTVAGAPSVVRIEAAAAVESVRRCSLFELDGGQCRWPISDPGKADFAFCGNAAIAGISYCAGHARLAYRLPSGRRA